MNYLGTEDYCKLDLKSLRSKSKPIKQFDIRLRAGALEMFKLQASTAKGIRIFIVC